jgi:glycosyltransferase involved in cell wall biosynthesis
MTDSLVSVCISTYNRVNLLRLAIESVLSQTYSDWELIICDDGSTDSTPEYMSTLGNQRIIYIRHPQHIGKSNNMRSGFEAARGKYFIKFDDDDRLDPNFLDKTINLLDQYSEVDFVSTDHWIIDSENNRDLIASQQCSKAWGRDQLPEGIVSDLVATIFAKGSLYIGSTLFRRQALQEVGYMRPNLQNCEDTDLLLRLALAGKTAYYLPQRLMEYRFHPEQKGIERAIPFLRDQLSFLQDYSFDLPTLEKFRQNQIAKVKLDLGLLLLKTDQYQEGRTLITEGKSASYLKACLGLSLGLLNSKWREKTFVFLDTMRANHTH